MSGGFLAGQAGQASLASQAGLAVVTLPHPQRQEGLASPSQTGRPTPSWLGNEETPTDRQEKGVVHLRIRTDRFACPPARLPSCTGPCARHGPRPTPPGSKSGVGAWQCCKWLKQERCPHHEAQTFGGGAIRLQAEGGPHRRQHPRVGRIGLCAHAARLREAHRAVQRVLAGVQLRSDRCRLEPVCSDTASSGIPRTYIDRISLSCRTPAAAMF